MSFFFYGAIALDNDEAAVRPILTNLLSTYDYRYWKPGQYQYQERLNLAKEKDYLIFDFEDSSPKIILSNYDAKALLPYYRLIAKQLGLPHWETMEFASHDLVNEIYSWQPFLMANLIYFLNGVFNAFPEKEIVIAIDDELKNLLSCEDVVEDTKQLLLAAWQRIAFGYKPTNMRLRYIPKGKATSSE